MADRANDEILQLAGQGNLQALSVYLNRHLIPDGAHVKIKHKEDALHVLIIVMRESVENVGLMNTIQQLLTQLHPTHVRRVKVYTQVLGQKQASLKQQFLVPSAPQAPPPSPKAAPAAPPVQLSSFQPNPYSSRGVQPPTGANERKRNASLPKEQRYSVAEFLSQATNIEDLKVLYDHPFFTGSCPRCQHRFAATHPSPVYWDCPKCSWRDDLSQVIPRSALRKENSQISLTESKRLGDYLVEAGLLSASQIEVALADQITSGLRFGEVLVQRGWVKEETIEYLMQKVVLPERVGSQDGPSYLESSRNLLKALLKVRPPSATSPLISPAPNGSNPPKQPASPPDAPKTSKAFPVAAGKLANERETLILPDMELDELDAYLKNGAQP